MRKPPEFVLISMAADLLRMHPQTLRKYERLGLVRPTRALGSMRVYSRDEIERIRQIKALVDEAGINLAGVQRLLSIAEVAGRLEPLVEQHRRETPNERLDAIAAEIDRLFELVGLTRSRG
jgi:MerR family transcriptional regulator, heat shock protein HspR